MSIDQLGWYRKRRYPDPIIPQELRCEVPELIDCTGAVLLPLDEAAVRTAVKRLSDRGVETFAVAFLWSFRNCPAASCACHLPRPPNERAAALIERFYDALTVMSDSATTDLGAKPGNFRL